MICWKPRCVSQAVLPPRAMWVLIVSWFRDCLTFGQPHAFFFFFNPRSVSSWCGPYLRADGSEHVKVETFWTPAVQLWWTISAAVLSAGQLRQSSGQHHSGLPQLGQAPFLSPPKVPLWINSLNNIHPH